MAVSKGRPFFWNGQWNFISPEDLSSEGISLLDRAGSGSSAGLSVRASIESSAGESG